MYKVKVNKKQYGQILINLYHILKRIKCKKF